MITREQIKRFHKGEIDFTEQQLYEMLDIESEDLWIFTKDCLVGIMVVLFIGVLIWFIY